MKLNHQSAATDRMRRVLAILLALLITLSATAGVVGVAALPAQTADRTPPVIPTDTAEALLQAVTPPAETVAETLLAVIEDPLPETEPEQSEETLVTVEILDIPETEAEPESEALPPAEPGSQEAIARLVEARMNKQVRGGTRISYPWPSGAMAVELYRDGRRILEGQVAEIAGTVYVPVQRFADLFGRFKTTYIEATEEVTMTGESLSIHVRAGDPYITVNERIFYTGKRVLSLSGWIFVPLASISRALDADMTVRRGYYEAYVTSGDPTTVAWADDFYDATDLYWLARIISAEARGEPFAGQIAVGNVVLNRVRSSQFPNTVKGVIFDTKYGTQFSPVSSGTIYNEPTASALRAAKICLEGYTLSSTMLYFYNPSIATSSWIGRTRPYVMTIGNHKFYD